MESGYPVNKTYSEIFIIIATDIIFKERNVLLSKKAKKVIITFS